MTVTPPDRAPDGRPADPTPLLLADNALYPLPLAEGGWLLIDAGPDLAPGAQTAVQTAVQTAAQTAAQTRASGPGRPGWEQLEAQLAARSLRPADVRAVLITHGHIDHAGLAARWAGAGARVLVGRADAAAVAGGRAWLDAQRERRAGELLAHGFPPALGDLLHAWGRAALTGWRWEPCPEAALQPLDGGETFALARDALRVIAAPGHTPGNLVAFAERGGALYSGDTLLPTTVPTPGLHFPGPAGPAHPTEAQPEERPRWHSLPHFIASVQALRAFDIERVRPGHLRAETAARLHAQGVGDDGAESGSGERAAAWTGEAPEPLFRRFFAHHERRQRRVLAALARDDGASAPTAYEVVQRLFPHLPEERTTQAMTELIGHLDLLVETGEVVRERAADGRWRHRLSR